MVLAAVGGGDLSNHSSVAVMLSYMFCATAQYSSIRVVRPLDGIVGRRGAVPFAVCP